MTRKQNIFFRREFRVQPDRNNARFSVRKRDASLLPGFLHLFALYARVLGIGRRHFRKETLKFAVVSAAPEFYRRLSDCLEIQEQIFIGTLRRRRAALYLDEGAREHERGNPAIRSDKVGVGLLPAVCHHILIRGIADRALKALHLAEKLLTVLRRYPGIAERLPHFRLTALFL